MVTVEKAKELLMKNIDTIEPLSVKTGDAVNCILAQDIFSTLDLPPFNQSAMDGYAIKLSGINKFKIIGEIKAGDKKFRQISDGEAIRIFTGSAVPSTSDCVVMQEKTRVKNNLLFIENTVLKKNENIRLRGSQIKKDELALKKGTKLSPAAIGFLASMGIMKIPVFRKPQVAFIITGNELKDGGKKLENGQIYESNSFTLKAALNEMGIMPKSIHRVRDNKVKLSEKIKRTLAVSDILIISGGISVGKYDLVRQCLDENGVEEIFNKVAQKPGKPLFAGKIGKKIIFALPGNPAAALVCHYEYIYPAIRKFMGMKDCFLPVKKIKISRTVTPDAERAVFLKGKLKNDMVIPLDGQESYILKSFAEADALIYIPAQEAVNRTQNGNYMVEVHLLT